MSNIYNCLIKYKEIIPLICDVFTAVGTVGAVIVALWLGYKDSKPKLKIFATLGIIYPYNTEHLWLSCRNVGKQGIACTGFAFNPNRFKRLRIMPNPTDELKNLSVSRPGTGKILQFSEQCESYFNGSFFNDGTIRKLLGESKWIAKMKLKFFWRVIANTNVGEFNGKLSSSFVNKFLSLNYPKKKK